MQRRMRRLYCCLLLATVLLSVCACKEEATPEEKAALKAKEYYDNLIYGRPEEWVKGHAGVGKMSDGYRQQLLENAYMFLDQQLQQHGGISNVTVSGEYGHHVSGSPVAILTLCFADASQEVIAVPMVEENGEWRMK